MAVPTNILPSNAPVVTAKGLFTGEWYRYFTGQNRVANVAVAGEVTTLPGSGLEGGGPVSEGISILIAPNGVSNAMIREGLPTSVIGRFQNTGGDVADIRAVQDRTVLQRRDDELGFFTGLDVASIVCDSFRIDQTPTAETVVCTHTITISVDGTDWKIPIVAA